MLQRTSVRVERWILAIPPSLKLRRVLAASPPKRGNAKAENARMTAEFNVGALMIAAREAGLP
jgi:hypothetical protein